MWVKERGEGRGEGGGPHDRERRTRIIRDVEPCHCVANIAHVNKTSHVCMYIRVMVTTIKDINIFSFCEISVKLRVKHLHVDQVD